MKAYYQVRANGIVIDAHDNCHNSIREADAYFDELSHLPGMTYDLIRIDTKRVKRFKKRRRPQ